MNSSLPKVIALLLFVFSSFSCCFCLRTTHHLRTSSPPSPHRRRRRHRRVDHSVSRPPAKPAGFRRTSAAVPGASKSPSFAQDSHPALVSLPCSTADEGSLENYIQYCARPSPPSWNDQQVSICFSLSRCPREAHLAINPLFIHSRVSSTLSLSRIPTLSLQTLMQAQSGTIHQSQWRQRPK
ncbi:hypothetical protein BJ166DRAFT_320349 [Pestalotiopsis sp. NC0098]|nr:hypothetical protein BJ166DRAFT_320349 [Pestalotiopsis sp. NC0098]